MSSPSEQLSAVLHGDIGFGRAGTGAAPFASAGARCIGGVRRRSLPRLKCRLFRDQASSSRLRRPPTSGHAARREMRASASASSARSGRLGLACRTGPVAGTRRGPGAALRPVAAVRQRALAWVLLPPYGLLPVAARVCATCAARRRKCVRRSARCRAGGSPVSSSDAGLRGADKIVHGGLRGGDPDGGKLGLGRIARVEQLE